MKSLNDNNHIVLGTDIAVDLGVGVMLTGGSELATILLTKEEALNLSRQTQLHFRAPYTGRVTQIDRQPAGKPKEYLRAIAYLEGGELEVVTLGLPHPWQPNVGDLMTIVFGPLGTHEVVIYYSGPADIYMFQITDDELIWPDDQPTEIDQTKGHWTTNNLFNGSDD